MDSRALAAAFVLTFSMATPISSVRYASFGGVIIQDWITEGADIVFVAFSKEPMSIAVCKFINSKFTVWTSNHTGLRRLIRRNRILNTPTIIFDIVQSKHVRGVIDSFASTNDTGVLTHWVLLLKEEDFNSHAKSLRKSAIHIDVSAISVDLMKSRTFLRCKKGLTENRCSLNSFVSKYSRSNSNPELFSGETIRLGCLTVGDYDTCNSQLSVQFISILSLKNASLKLATYRSSQALYYDVYTGKVHLVLVKTVLRQGSLELLSFADVTFVYGSFYALHNKTRVVSLFDAITGSNSGFFALFSLISCAVAAAAANRQRGPVAYLLGTLNEGFYLLAPLLGVSSQLPLMQRTSLSHALVYFVWIIAILPFSVYFRSTLVSLVTVRRPADVLDTLNELESGLDAGRVFPCVMEGSSAHTDLEGIWNEGGALLTKLRAAYRIKMRDGLLKPSATDCFRCATEENGVCFIIQYPICMVKNAFSEIGEFKEHFMADFWVFPMPKESNLTGPLKRFMGSIRAGSLLKPDALSCEKNIPIQGTTHDIFPFLANWFVLVCMCAVVLICEVLVGRFCSRP